MSCPRSPVSYLESESPGPCAEPGTAGLPDERTLGEQSPRSGRASPASFSGVGKAAEHPRARSKPLPFSGLTCPGRPGTAPPRKPSSFTRVHTVPDKRLGEKKTKNKTAGPRICDLPDHPRFRRTSCLPEVSAFTDIHCPFVPPPVVRRQRH